MPVDNLALLHAGALIEKLHRWAMSSITPLPRNNIEQHPNFLYILRARSDGVARIEAF